MERDELKDIDLPKNFHGVWIDAIVWKDKKLTWIEKCILCEIHWLYTEAVGNDKRGCWASNQYLAKMFDLHPKSVSRIINKLISLDYLKLLEFNGRTRILKSTLVLIKSKG